MHGWTLNSIWQLVTSSFSIANLIGIAAVAAAVFSENIILKFAIPDLRKWAIIVAVCAFGYSTVYTKGFNHGLSVKQAEIDAAVKREADNGEKARSDAVNTVRAAPPDSVRLDPRNRDNWRRK